MKKIGFLKLFMNHFLKPLFTAFYSILWNLFYPSGNVFHYTIRERFFFLGNYVDKSFYSEKNCATVSSWVISSYAEVYMLPIWFSWKVCSHSLWLYPSLISGTCPHESWSSSDFKYIQQTVKPKSELWIWRECRISPILQQNFIFLRSIIASLSN